MRIKEKGLAHPIQERVSEFNKNELLPALAEVCDQLVGPDRRVRIDKIEINLGSISIDKFESSFKTGFINQFKRQVQQMMLKTPALVETEPNAWDTATLKEAEVSQRLFTKVDLVCYFLEKGTIPWWHPARELNMKETVNEVILKSPQLLAARMVPRLNSRQIRLRITETLTDEQLIKLIDPLNELGLNQIVKKIKQLFKQGIIKPHTFRELRQAFFDQVLSVLPASDASDFLNLVFGELKEESLLYQLMNNISPSELELLFKPEAKSTSEVRERSMPKPVSKKKPDDEPQPIGKQPEGSYLEINNAGIVLLWPYLEMFFKELKLVEDKGFADEQSQWKAVQLLHYLVFGDEEAEEHQWALNKILCGMHFSDFVPVEFEISDTEKEECRNLLQSVINNWKALKNTSVQGLQQAFLRRNGLLKMEQNSFVVEIERTAIDVLLDKLSWPISVISLPWNTGLIHVKW